MTTVSAPLLGERVLDPAAGTGGFLTAAIDHVREKSVHSLDDEATLQTSVSGWEYKPVSYVLGLTNLILHGLEVPDFHSRDSLKSPSRSQQAGSGAGLDRLPKPTRLGAASNAKIVKLAEANGVLSKPVP